VFLGFPALRLKGVYFSIFTMITVFAVRQAIILSPSITRGATGIVNVPGPGSLRLGPWNLDMSSKGGYFILVYLLLIAAACVMRRIDESRVGLIFAAIREREALAESVGINVTHYKVLAFGIAAVLSGWAGGLSAGYYRLAHPEVWGLWPSIFIIAYAIVGGVKSVYGPIVGSAVVISVSELLRTTEGLQVVLLGLTLIGLMFYLPEGLVGGRISIRQVARVKEEFEAGPNQLDAQGDTSRQRAVGRRGRRG
jgi:branched-chain amino acid transport system permease protein